MPAGTGIVRHQKQTERFHGKTVCILHPDCDVGTPVSSATGRLRDFKFNLQIEGSRLGGSLCLRRFFIGLGLGLGRCRLLNWPAR